MATNITSGSAMATTTGSSGAASSSTESTTSANSGPPPVSSHAPDTSAPPTTPTSTSIPVTPTPKPSPPATTPTAASGTVSSPSIIPTSNAASPPESTQSVILTIIPTTESGQTSTITSLITSFESNASTPTSTSTSSSSTSGMAGLQSSGKSTTSKGLVTGGTIAVAVVVPIVAVALLVLAGLFLWRKRKAMKDAEELRRKEVEEYGYNPNNDPTLPVAGSGIDGPFEMQKEGGSGYRGWGTTAVNSSGRKASTTLSGGQSAGGAGMAYSEATSPGLVSDTRSDNPLVDGYPSGDGEALGALGPAASANRGGDINRGPSNASSSYSAANRSDGSGDTPGAGGAYYNQYDSGNPYTDTAYGSPPSRVEMGGQPVIRDVQARRNTRIENPSHFPQQSAGISQNF